VSVLLAFDKFKGSLTQSELTEIVESYLSAIGIKYESILMADGGDGSVDALIAQGWREKSLEVTGPLDNTHSARFAVSNDHSRVAIELAELCGIKYLNGNLAPFATSSRAIGEALVKIKPSNFEELVVCLGGSASVDGGAGLLQSLGVKILDSHGTEVSPGLAGLVTARSIDTYSLDHVRRTYIGECKIRVLSDTSASLTGFHGAALSFGRQKGLSFLGVIRAEIALQRWKKMASTCSGTAISSIPGQGCAGGIGFAFQAFLGAEIESGSEFFLRESGAADALLKSSMVVTGEGRIDKTTLTGKSIFPVLELARNLNKKIVLICGSADESILRHLKNNYPVVEVIRLSDFNRPLHQLIRDARVLLKEALKKVPIERWSQ
jgi:glycerate 2-kinase